MRTACRRSGRYTAPASAIAAARRAARLRDARVDRPAPAARGGLRRRAFRVRQFDGDPVELAASRDSAAIGRCASRRWRASSRSVDTATPTRLRPPPPRRPRRAQLVDRAGSSTSSSRTVPRRAGHLPQPAAELAGRAAVAAAASAAARAGAATRRAPGAARGRRPARPPGATRVKRSRRFLSNSERVVETGMM